MLKTVANLETHLNQAIVPTHVGGTDAEATMHRCFANERSEHVDKEVCLVQIYPADVVRGMMLLEQDAFVIGRDPASDLVLSDHSVSRQHASISLDRDGYYAEDLESTNGTFVNGNLIARCRLESGDTVQIGTFIFKFLSAGSVESHYHETIYTAMTRDGLTGTMNKRYLLESMQREIARCARQRQPLSVVMIDIDHFKSVNDSHGHLVGDEVLREFGRRLLSVCREESLLARYGGEEFSLLLSSTDGAEAIEVCQRCRAEIANTRFSTSAGPLAITASFGIGCLPVGQPMPVTDLIKIADDRLYDAKKQGRNRVVI
ncbi:GGDEF domain-containing protein [Neorhodopirellula pilleata]|uniref:diguanylate cyclase n=1 Tax=Neorhodopirellula pilleata TaxID=2714738 RepID=A0A5C6A494_9BACT|nr:GGDEF domain-containing protein [Neorhodopirellula pilleata]TWT94329.1 Diguanylate cyclase DosC [Neorhodopirellula pilleata]